MLGLDTEFLQQYKGEARTKQFWLLLRRLPFTIPSFGGKKLKTPDFRWAPETMMHPSTTTLDTEIEGQKNECTENGLIATYLTVELSIALTGYATKRGSIFYVWVGG